METNRIMLQMQNNLGTRSDSQVLKEIRHLEDAQNRYLAEQTKPSFERELLGQCDIFAEEHAF
jgi:hypothetical protein